MKLKSYILVGYIISTLLTIIVVFWAVQKMLIAKSEIYFLLGMTIVASLVGAGISLFSYRRYLRRWANLRNMPSG